MITKQHEQPDEETEDNDKDINIDNNDSEEIPDGEDVDLNRAE